MRKRVYYIHGFDQRGVDWYYKFFKKSKPSNMVISELKNNNNFSINDDIEYVILDWQNEVKKYWYKFFKFIGIEIMHFFYVLFSVLFITKKYQYIKNHSSKILFVGTLKVLIILFWIVLALPIFFINYRFGLFAISIAISMVFYIYLKLNLVWFVRTNSFMDRNVNDKLLEHVAERFFKQIMSKEEIDPASEILLIAHSAGSIFAHPTLRLIIEAPISFSNKITLVTLGSVLPHILYAPTTFMKNNIDIAAKNGINWHDFTGKADAVCYYNVNVYNILEIKENNLYMHSVPFSRLFHKNTWRKIRRNKLFVHFLYLKQFNYKYSYFDMITSKNSHLYLLGNCCE